jgi:integrase
MNGMLPITIIFFRCWLSALSTFIEDITPHRLLVWRNDLRQSGYAEATVASIFKTIRAMCNVAVEQDWLSKSPMKNIPRSSFINRNNDRLITMEEYDQLLEACPTLELRVIIAAARIGGLRVPSELTTMRWHDIDWERNRILVRSPKTERHAGHREREVPLFPPLRVELEKLRLQVQPKEDDFVIQSFQGTWNLHEPFRKIAIAAGLGKIVRPFDNMRMTRSNEVIREFGETKENLWIGHSRVVMQDHYYRLSDEDFAEAARPKE